MKRFSVGLAVVSCLFTLLLLSGCGEAERECDSLDARNSVMKIIRDDNNNALVNFALKNSSSLDTMMGVTKSEPEKMAIWENAKRGAIYKLDDPIIIKSSSRATREVTCSGILSVTVADTTAEKEMEFRVEHTTDGKMLVSVSPFLF